MPLHTLVIDFLNFFSLKNQKNFFNLRVLYMDIFTLKAYNSTKEQQMTEIFQDVNQAELGTSLFEIALSLFALERTFILRAMALLETKSEAL